jgi:hypothetical protein
MCIVIGTFPIIRYSPFVGGAEYREEIAKAVDNASVMVLMLNEEWALSRECLDEYSYAKRLNLTSKGSYLF